MAISSLPTTHSRLNQPQQQEVKPDIGAAQINPEDRPSIGKLMRDIMLYLR